MFTRNLRKFLDDSNQSIFTFPEIHTHGHSDARYYGKVFEKLKTDPHYPMNEKRRLEAIIAKGNLASEKYGFILASLIERIDGFKVRINILSAFEVLGKGPRHEEL